MRLAHFEVELSKVDDVLANELLLAFDARVVGSGELDEGGEVSAQDNPELSDLLRAIRELVARDQ